MARGVRAWPVLLGLAGVFGGGCLGNYRYMSSAPPIASAVQLAETSPDVARALGGPVSVSLVVTRRLRRTPLGWLGGTDHVTLDTRVKGARGEATLYVSAIDIGGQGWVGDFKLEQEGRSVLRDGRYVTEGGGRILEGRFTADGSAVAGAR